MSQQSTEKLAALLDKYLLKQKEYAVAMSGSCSAAQSKQYIKMYASYERKMNIAKKALNRRLKELK